MNIRIYTKPGCHDCAQARALANSRKVEYQAVVIDPQNPPPELAPLGWGGKTPFVVTIAEEPSDEVFLAMIGCALARSY